MNQMFSVMRVVNAHYSLTGMLFLWFCKMHLLCPI